MLENTAIISQIKDILLSSKRILLIPHQNPDADALGSVSAMAQFLLLNKIDYKIFCKNLPDDEYAFIPLAHQIHNNPEVFNEDFEAVVVLDSGDLNYAGVAEYIKENRKYVLINIDHHYTNEGYGDVNLLSKESSSVCELLTSVFKIWGVRLNKEIATALMAGLVFDTGNMSNPATSQLSLNTAATLLASGARRLEIQKGLLKNKTLNMLKLWGRAMDRLFINPKNNFAVTVITKEDLGEFGINPESSSGLINFFNELADVSAIMLLTEQADGTIKGSLRTTRDEVDVSAIAKSLGGGGHKKAAGFTISGKLLYNEGKWTVI